MACNPMATAYGTEWNIEGNVHAKGKCRKVLYVDKTLRGENLAYI